MLIVSYRMSPGPLLVVVFGGGAAAVKTIESAKEGGG
jgi:hypothetical protein